MKAVILAGGLGTRLREETEYKPKPMVEIGRRPILWHIMKNLSTQGINEFIICAGYKSEYIKNYFLNYDTNINDLTVNLGSRSISVIHNKSELESWTVTIAETGLETMTGGRIKKIEKYLNNESFLCTYGDGLADIDLKALTQSHKNAGTIATLTAVAPTSRFGGLKIGENSIVESFIEKPRDSQYVNGGFFIFEPDMFRYLGDNSVLEKEPLENLTNDHQLSAYIHNGFWQPMDTYRETQELNFLWDNNRAPWKNWS